MEPMRFEKFVEKNLVKDGDELKCIYSADENIFKENKKYKVFTNRHGKLRIKDDFDCIGCATTSSEFILEEKTNINEIGGGKRFNLDKPRLELLVPEAMEAEARVWAMGAEKYGEYNWQKGMKWTIILACILRHTFAIMRGEDFDKESGELHAAHIKCNASMLIYYFHHFKEGDDREPSKRV